MSEVQTIKLARIEKFDQVKMIADITVLQTEEGRNNEIFNVPVSAVSFGDFVIRPSYKKGDIVIIGFSNLAIDDVLLSGKPTTSDVTETFRDEDCFVLQGALLTTQRFPDEHNGDLVIAKKDFSSKIVMKENGDMEFITSGNMKFDASRYDFVE